MGITPAKGTWTGAISAVAGTTMSTGGAGQLIGYSRPGWYNAAVPAGTIQTDLFVDRRIANAPKTIRMMGVVQQASSFLVIGWKLEPTIVPDPSMPSMQGSIRLFGKAFTLSSALRPGVQAGYDGLYWEAPNVGIVSGQPFTFEFS